MKITLAQINPHPGNLSENSRKITGEIRKASQEGTDLIIFPELSVTGYPALDLLDYNSFMLQTEKVITEITAECTQIAAIIGAPTPNPVRRGKRLYNSALFIANGKIVKTFNKALLPTYDVFDEYRYFEPAADFDILTWKGVKLAITICEDLWDEQAFDHVKESSSLYLKSTMEKISKLDPDLVINISASPFAHNRVEAREKTFIAKATKYNIPVIMVNQVGANTDLVFDGASLVIDPGGKIMARLPFFEEAIFSFESEKIYAISNSAINVIPSKIELIYMAIVTGIRDYLAKTGQKKVVIGLSGGIDSAVCTALATEALGSDNVTVLLMPSRYSSNHSITDAVKLANNLGIRYEIVEIEKPFTTFEKILDPLFKDKEPDTTEENIQARIRTIILMAYANKFRHLLLNTSNKSESATGYGTLYGDMAGALSPIGDVYKSDVFSLARYINRKSEIIPGNTITKPPSAELKENQLDSDSLPSYDALDRILFMLIELMKDPESIIEEGFDPATVHRVTRLVSSNEYKRYQSPPAIRVSTKAFGYGRRIPLISGFTF